MVSVEILAPELVRTLGGVMQLRGSAFVEAIGLEPDFYAAIAIVLAAGFSEALGQSIVLFANRVKPARFVFSLLIDALLFAFGYGFLVLSTWTVTRLPGTAHLSFRELALIFAVSYAPLLFSFLGALPYLGSGLLRILRIWHLLVMVVGISAVGRVDVFAAATYVWLGWLVMVLAQHSFGKPIATVGSWLLDAVAGVRVIDDAQLAIGQAERGSGHSPDAPRVAVQAKTSKHPKRWLTIVGLGGMALLAAIVALALEPVRQGVLGWQKHLPGVLQLPLDLLWLGVIAFVVAGFMAPLETLGWWAGWYGDEIDTSEATRPSRPAGGSAGIARYVVYLDGIAQSSDKYTPDIETFLDALTPELPANVRLVRGVMAYSVLNKPLEDDPLLSWFWKLIEASRGRKFDSLLGMFVNLRNVTIVAVSADPRFGPMYNFGIADVIYRALVANGYAKKSGIPVTLIGYSGGGQMACGAAAFLKRALDAPVDVISLGGVISGNDPILQLEHLHHLVGDKDRVERIGPVMFASRWPIALLSNWNRAKRMGTLTCVSLGPVAHQVPGGLLDPNARLPDGRTYLRQTLDDIHSILTDRFEAGTTIAKKPSNYGRYEEGAGRLWTALGTNAHRPPPGSAYLPVAAWMGRLALPQRDERFGGAWLDVTDAPPEYAALAGTRVRLQWSSRPEVRERLRAVVRDVNFSAQAQSASEYGGLIMPVRLNRWRLVDPLESLAGAHPVDDAIVKLAGPVTVQDDGRGTTVFIEREPVQITGRYYGLVSFRGPAAGTDDGFKVVHFERTTRAFGGSEEIVRLPPVAADLEGRPNSTTTGIDRSPLNAGGWYVYGGFDDGGTFVVQALAPRALLRADAPRRELAQAREARHYVRREAWRELVRAKGDVVTAAQTVWEPGDVGLLVHTYGGIGGRKREAASSGPIYFGHFAYGVAEVVDDPIAGEPRFALTYYQVYTQNADGLTAGAHDWSHYLGDRQFGWAGVRPVCDALVRHEAFTQAFDLQGGGRRSALEALVAQLEAMTARYRIGDGTGGTFVGAANNCSQDSNHAFFATLRAMRRYVETHPDLETWMARSPQEYQRYRALVGLTAALRRQLQPFGAPRHDWSENQYNLGTTMEDAPLANLLTALGSWRCILPRLAFDTIVGTFLAHGGTVTVLGCDQIGGERPDVAPVVPTTL